MKHICFILVFVVSILELRAQSFYYVRKDPPPSPAAFYLGIFDVGSCQGNDLFQISSLGFGNSFGITDMAVSPSGDFYFTVNSNAVRYLTKLQIPSNTLDIVYALPSSCNALTCDANGVLWVGGGGVGLLSYDPSTGIATSYGLLNFFSGGDLTFRDGKLYGISVNNEIMEINIEDPSQSTVAFALSLPFNLDSWGVISSVESCDSSSTFVTVTNNNNINAPALTINQLYQVDFATQTATYLCDTPGPIYGAASAAEFLASDCSVRLDLDLDDSSVTTDTTDFQAQPLCGNLNALNAVDTDAVFYSGYHVDSLRARLLPPLLDAPLEYLTAQTSGTVGVAGQGTPWVTFTTPSNTAVVTANADYQTALRSLRWHNDAVPITTGPRTIEVVAYASGGRTDTAYAFLSVPSPVNAGADTILAVCADAPPFDLAALLATNSTAGGQWTPPTAAGNTILSPSTDFSGTFYYLVSGGLCPTDTASVAINIFPLPVFSLGFDTSLCAGDVLTLTAPEVAQWFDGTTANAYTADHAGLYWAEIVDAAGCSWRDSIQLTVHQPSVTEQSATACSGSTYAWNNMQFIADTSICITFTAANGCDSLDCLNLAFFYPSLALDTVVCSGQTLMWLGQTFSQPGFFYDTLFYDGCLHAVSLNLASLPFLQTAMEAGICPDDSLNFHGIWLSAPGVYTDTFQSHAGGCDSLVTLTLSFLTVPQPDITGVFAVCGGETTTLAATPGFSMYAWSDGTAAPLLEAMPGIYAVTVTDFAGCHGADTVLVTSWPPITAAWDNGPPLCHGSNDGFIELTDISGGLPPYVFEINNQNHSTTAFFQNLPAGTWDVEVTDSAGCTATYVFELNEPPALDVYLGASPLLEAGIPYAIPLHINTVGTFDYVWSPPGGLSCTDCSAPVALPAETTTYTLYLTDANGCTASNSVELRVLEQEPEVYAPNVFSPDGDGQNDWFTLFGDPSVFVAIEVLQVYDRWGNMVFEGRGLPLNDESRGWDGSFRGKVAQQGVYTFYAEIRKIEGGILKKSGEITKVKG